MNIHILLPSINNDFLMGMEDTNDNSLDMYSSVSYKTKIDESSYHRSYSYTQHTNYSDCHTIPTLDYVA